MTNWLDQVAGPFVDKCVVVESEVDDTPDLLSDTTAFVISGVSVLSFYLSSIKHSAVRTRLEHEIAHVIEASDERFWLPNLGMPDRYCIGPVWAEVEIRCLGIEVALARQLGLPSDYEPADVPISQYVPWLASIHHGADTLLIRRRLTELYEKAALFPDPVGEFRRKLRLLT